MDAPLPRPYSLRARERHRAAGTKRGPGRLDGCRGRYPGLAGSLAGRSGGGRPVDGCGARQACRSRGNRSCQLRFHQPHARIMLMARIDIGIIGCGNISNSYLKGAARSELVRMRGVADVRMEAAHRPTLSDVGFGVSALPAYRASIHQDNFALCRLLDVSVHLAERTEEQRRLKT